MNAKERYRITCLVTVCVSLVFPASLYAYAAILNKTDHTEMHLVPTPGAVSIDGDLKDWDLSASILMFIDEKSKATHSVQGSMMYDEKYLYIGARVKDPTPMVNSVDFGGAVDSAWNSDAIQIRFVSNPDITSVASINTGGRMSAEEQVFVNHITLWYSTKDKKAGYQAVYTLRFSDPVLNPPGVQGVYVKDADGKGYAFEYRIPWPVLRAPRPLKGGDTVQLQWQLHWGNNQGTTIRTGMTDVRNLAATDLGYMGPSSWGKGIFEKTGDFKRKNREGNEWAKGHIPIPFSLGKDSKVSLAIWSRKGTLLRTCLGAQPYATGDHIYLWDGLDDQGRTVPSGKYNARILTHGGITQKYVCDVGVSGTPPYQTEDDLGGWAGDYWEPTYVAIEGDRVILGTGCAEAQKPTICTDLEGRKLYGTWARGVPLALYDGYGYLFLKTLTKFDLATGTLAPFTGGQPEVQGPPGKGIRHGLVVVNKSTIVLGADDENKLYLIDLASGKTKGDIALPSPKGLATDGKGTLYAISRKTIGRVNLKTGEFSPVTGDLDDPKMLACDAQGNIYVSLWGKTMQVWKLNPNGKVLKKFGKAGGRPLLGTFDARGMLKPYAIAVDNKNDRLWVCENDRQPKRYSVWNDDGTLWKDFFGSLPYSTSAYIDLKQPEYIYAENVRYLIDYDKGTWRTDATILRERTENGVTLPAVPVHAGARFINHQGRKFLVFSGQRNVLSIYEAVGDTFLPRLRYEKKTFWIDGNNDGRVQSEESTPWAGVPMANCWIAMVDKELNLYSFDGNRWLEPSSHGRRAQPYDIVRLDFQGFNRKGGLTYAKETRVVASDPDGGSIGEITIDAEGSIYVSVSGGFVERYEKAHGTGNRIVKFSAAGKKLWEYHNVQLGFAWTSSTYTPGFVVGAFRNCSPDHPDLLPITGYYGQYFLLDKKEGFFVDVLGQDQRSAYTLDNTMVLTENFNGAIWQHPKTGKSYFAGGDADCRVWELTGLDTLERSRVTVRVNAGQAIQSAANNEHNRNLMLTRMALTTGRKTATLFRLTKPMKAEDWKGIPSLPIGDDKARRAQIQLGYDNKNLYARFEVSTETPFANASSDFKLLFKSGSAVELCLTANTRKRKTKAQNIHTMTPGDLRLVIARTKDGNLVATRYRPKIKERKKPCTAYFETQASGRETFDEIMEWNDLPMHYQAIAGGYTLAVAIPWSITGTEPKPGVTIHGDVGVIYGNRGGTRNAVRAMWSDRSPEVGVNNDIPTESRLHPNDWGVWVFE